jgi:adenylate kinase family enzyme
MKKLIILRGPSGSGKSTTAQLVRERLLESGVEKVAIIPQDVVRREVLKEKDRSMAVNIKMIESMVEFVWSEGYVAIVEGILDARRYSEMLLRIVKKADECQAWYFDISFEETLNRHETKPNAHEYGEKEMREWYQERDLVEGLDERLIGSEVSQEEIVMRVCGEQNSHSLS